MTSIGKNILFYNAIPMPHSMRIHQLLEESGYHVNFWYYKDLTKLYPWNSLHSAQEYYVYGRNGSNIFKLLKQTWYSDFVIITGWHTRIHVFLSIFCYLFHIKYAYWSDVPEKPITGFKSAIKRILLKMTDYVLVTGEEGVTRISAWYKLDKSKFRDFPYLSANIDNELISNINQLRQGKLVGGDKIKVLICNRFERRKGYGSVYEALKITDKKILEKYCFTILGSGAEFEHYKELFTNLLIDINFKFWLEYEEYLKLIQETDILIHASLHEPFGIPPIDAMANGKLVIASDGVMSTYDRIINGENGFKYSSGDYEELSEILFIIANNSNIIYELGARAQTESLKYTFDYNVEKINEIIENTVKN